MRTHSCSLIPHPYISVSLTTSPLDQILVNTEYLDDFHEIVRATDSLLLAREYTRRIDEGHALKDGAGALRGLKLAEEAGAKLAQTAERLVCLIDCERQASVFECSRGGKNQKKEDYKLRVKNRIQITWTARAFPGVIRSVGPCIMAQKRSVVGSGPI